MTRRDKHQADDDTQWLDALRTDDWDGTTITFGGASSIGLPDEPVPPWRPEGERFADSSTWANHEKLPLEGYQPSPASFPALAPAAIPQFQPPPEPAQLEATPIGDATARGWQHLFAVRCQYPASPHATPIPCGTEYRDDGAPTLPALYESAWDAGWRTDALGRWCCRPCAQHHPEFRTTQPLTFWVQGAPAARENGAYVNVLDTAGQPVIDPATGQPERVPGEHVLIAAEEARWFRDTVAASQRGKHRLTLTGAR